MTRPFNTDMKISWGWLPFTGTVCALGAMIATQMTENIWSAHTSMTGWEVVEQLGDKVSEDFAKANDSFVGMEAQCQETRTLIHTLSGASPEELTQFFKLLKASQHWWQRGDKHP